MNGRSFAVRTTITSPIVKHTLTLLASLLLAQLTPLHAATSTTANLFDASALVPPPHEETFTARDGKAEWVCGDLKGTNIPFLSDGLEALQKTTDGAVKFALGTDGAVLGFGNYDGKQPLAERVNYWAGPMTVSVTLRASATGAVSFLPWCDGLAGGKRAESREVRALNRKRTKPEGVSAKFSGGAEWETVAFKTDSLKCPDGFELEFVGSAGASVEVKSVRFSRDMHEGFWRKEFTLPAGKVWRAVGDVSMMCSLFVNGCEVPSANGMVTRPHFNFAQGLMFNCEAVDLAPFLRAGTNAVALHVARNGAAPYVYGSFTVVMESGEVVRVGTDGTWKYSPTEPLAAGAKVSAPGFDQSAWSAAQARKGMALNFKQADARPAYAGRIVIENPAEPYLFFQDGAPVEFHIALPPGLKDTELEWNVKQFADGKFSQGASGTTREPLIRAGTLPRGVYTLEVILKRGGEVLEERIPEPFVVVGQIPMREVAGDTLVDGLDLAMEAEIDFTKPDSAIPWQETTGLPGGLITTPVITERGGLRYRETSTERGALISHRYTFTHPGDFYLMELEFPDDAERWFGVSCTSSTNPENSKDGPATWTGRKYPLSGKMKTMQWIARPDPGPTAINLSNLQRGTTAAARRLRISHIKNGLPALKFADANARLIGQYTERTSPVGGFGKTFGFFTEAENEQRAGTTRPNNDPVLAMCRRLAHDLDAAEHYAMWLRFTGQNLHVMGCLQYFESNTGLTPPSLVPDARLLADSRDVAVRVLGANGIKVIANLEYVCASEFVRRATMNDGQVALGTDTPYLVDRDGRQPWNWLGRYGLNFMHPQVEANMMQIARETQRKCGTQPNFLGVSFVTYLGGDFLPSFTTQGLNDPLGTSFDDVTIARFENETGTVIPGARDAREPQRFTTRADFLLAPSMKEKWLQWRCEKTRDFFTKLQRELATEKNATPNFFPLLYVDVNHAQAWKASGLTLRDYLRQYGWSPEVYQNQPGLWFPKWTHATERYASMLKIPNNQTWPAAWEMSVGDEYNRTFDQPANRASFVMTHWQEHERNAETLDARDGWPRAFQMTYQAQANGDNAREVFTQNLLTTDPELVVWGFSDLVAQTGHEQPLREFARTLRALPKAKLMPSLGTTLQSNLVLREVRDGGKLWFIAANPGCWPIRAEVYVEKGAPVRDAVSGNIIAENKNGGHSIVPLDLKPYEVRAFVVNDSRAKLAGWKNQPIAEPDLAHLRTVLADAEQTLADKSRAARLPPAEREFMAQQIAAVKAALASQEIAKGWSLITDWRFWTDTRTRITPMRAVK
jgi:hypothetical protein